MVTSDYEVFLKKTRKPETIIVTPTADSPNRLGRRIENRSVQAEPPPERPAPFQATQLALNVLVFIVLPVFIVSTLLFYTKSGSAEKRNQILLTETKQLRDSLVSLEELNKGLTLRLEKLKQEKKTISDKLALLEGGKKGLGAPEKERFEKELAQIREEKGYLEEILINKTKEIERLKRGLPGGAGATAVSSEPGGRDEEIRRLTEQNRELSQKLERLYKSASDKITEINLVKIALEETVSKAKDTLNEEWGAVDLGSIRLASAAERGRIRPATAGGGESGAPKTQGRVLAVNEEQGFVVVDLGKADHIKTGEELSVTRDGRTLATLSILETRDTMSACNIKDLDSGEAIAVNDAVLTK
ncbi:MAG: hypothetical protein HYT89_03615 [Candidatus Omnitrophica bacterium]|nr:hypothetical protein [Candidatus Omnitrophota bacterium]